MFLRFHKSPKVKKLLTMVTRSEHLKIEICVVQKRFHQSNKHCNLAGLSDIPVNSCCERFLI